jgi:hypothetical protein
MIRAKGLFEENIYVSVHADIWLWATAQQLKTLPAKWEKKNNYMYTYDYMMDEPVDHNLFRITNVLQNISVNRMKLTKMPENRPIL